MLLQIVLNVTATAEVHSYTKRQIFLQSQMKTKKMSFSCVMKLQENVLAFQLPLLILMIKDVLVAMILIGKIFQQDYVITVST